MRAVARWPNDLALVAAAVLATLALQRDFIGPGRGPRHEIEPQRDVPDHAAGPEVAATMERGRLARSPWQIPLKGWKDILHRTYQQINEDRLLATAAGVVFYGLLAIFPAITAVVSSYGLFARCLDDIQ